jgi:predicted deacylase
LTVESGLLGRSDAESVEAIVSGVHGVLRELRMMEHGPAAVSSPVYLDPAEVVASPETGILYWHVERDQTVTQGELLAHVTDFFGKRIAEIESPLDGLVLYVVATPPISKGQPVACIAARGTSAYGAP